MNRQIDQWDRIKGPEIEIWKLSIEKGDTSNYWNKDGFKVNGAGKSGESFEKKIKLDTYLTSHKNRLQMDLRAKCKKLNHVSTIRKHG